jgi:hypothetical protein
MEPSLQGGSGIARFIEIEIFLPLSTLVVPVFKHGAIPQLFTRIEDCQVVAQWLTSTGGDDVRYLTFEVRGGRKWAKPACGRPLD